MLLHSLLRWALDGHNWPGRDKVLSRERTA